MTSRQGRPQTASRKKDAGEAVVLIYGPGAPALKRRCRKPPVHQLPPPGLHSSVLPER